MDIFPDPPGRATRRAALRALGAAAVAWASSPRAQAPPRLPVVGFLASGGPDTQTSLRNMLKELGWIEGKTVVFELRAAYGRPEVMPTLAKELVARGVDVLCASGPPGVRAAMATTRTIPIVAFDLETDPVAAGWVASLARPGGNLTGCFLDIPAVAGKWLELIQLAAPGRTPVGLLWDSTTGEWQLRAAQDAARRLPLDVRVIEIRRADELRPSLTAAVKGGTRALAMLSSPTIAGQSKSLADIVTGLHLPALSPFKAFADSGGLMSYGPDLDDFRLQLAAYVDRILKGAAPGELPVQGPTRFELVVNPRAAERLGLMLPPSLLLRADRRVP